MAHSVRLDWLPHGLRAALVAAAFLFGAPSSLAGPVACSRQAACLQPSTSRALDLPSGRAWVAVSAGPADARRIVATNTSGFAVRFVGFGFGDERVLGRFEGVDADCGLDDVRTGYVHISDGSSEDSLPLTAPCGSSLNVR